MSNMAVTEGGTEFAFLVSYLSGFLLGVPFISRFFSRFQTIGFLLCLVGVTSSFTSNVFNRYK